MLGTVGKWRVSKTDHEDIKLPYENITQKKALDIPIVEPTTNQIPLTIAEEYDVDKICDIFEDKKRVVILPSSRGLEKALHACTCETEVTKRSSSARPTSSAKRSMTSSRKWITVSKR